jgi:hypothetical protein
LELHELVLPAARLLQRNLSILRPKSMGRTRNNLLEPTRRPHSLRHRWRGGPAVPRTSLCAASRRVAQLHSKQRTTSSASTAQRSAAQHPAAQTGLHLGDFAASCCLVLSGRCSYGGLRELRSTLAPSLPRYVHSSLLSSASTPPYQARPDRHPPIPQSPSLPPYFLALHNCIIPLFACAPPICSSFCPSRTRTTHQAALSLPPCLINR